MECVHRKCAEKNSKIQVFVENDLLLEKFSSSVPKGFMTTPIHIVCSNFTEIGRQEKWVKRCAVLVKSSQNAFFATTLHQMSQCLHVKFHHNRFWFAGVV